MAVRREDLGWQRSAVVYRFPPVRERRLRLELLRRRLALATVAVVVVIAGLLGTGPQGIAPASGTDHPRAVVVDAGDTLWDIAERHVPEGVDTRAYLDAILELNGVGVIVDPGTRLRLP